VRFGELEIGRIGRSVLSSDALAQVRESQQAESAASRSEVTDSFSDSLLFLAARHGRPLSREALLAGLPISDNRLSVALFSRAAQRAGLEVEPVKRKLPEIPSLVLPAVLIMRDGSTRIMIANDSDPKNAKVVDPSVKPREAPRPLGADAANYLGYAFLVRPASQANARVAAGGDLPSAHWFWSIVGRFWPNYGHVAVAALIVNVLGLAAPLFTMNVYDRVVPNGAIPSLVALSIGMTISIVFDFVLRTVRSRIIDLTGKKIDVVLAADIFEHVQAVKMAQRPTSVGILANQIRDFDSVREFFTSGAVVSATDLLFAFIFIAILVEIAGPLAWIAVVMVPLMMITGLILQYPLGRAMRKLQAESAARHGVLIEALSSLETVRAIGAEARMQTAWEQSVAATARSGEGVHFWASLALTISNTAQQITIC
jgi:ATP-binding cassette subfamily C protein LapB